MGEGFPSAAQPNGDPRRELVRRIVNSSAFQRSTKLREFLIYVSEHALRNQPGEVTEQLIGVRVMGRRPDYDPNTDNIVRVQARHLRQRLQAYFEGEGREEPLMVEIPKGSYLPVFKPRPAKTLQLPFPRRAIAVALPWTLAAALAGIAGWLALSRRSSEDPLLHRLPWSQVLDLNSPTTIVLADSCFALLQDWERSDKSLKEYLAPAPYAADSFQALLTARQFTSLADAVVAAQIGKIAEAGRNRVQIRYARNLQLRDLRSGNFIFLGSSRSNPWVELFDGARNFHAEFDRESRRPYFLNRRPQQGEQEIYWTEGVDRKSGETYSAVAFLPGQDSSGNVLIIEGTNMEGTEAAGEFITRLATLDRLLRVLPAGTRHFEVLLRSTAMAGATRDTQIIAWRVVK